MTIRRTLSAASARLAAAGVPDSAYDAQAMLAHVLGEDRLRMRAEADRKVPQEAAARYGAMYLLGKDGNVRRGVGLDGRPTIRVERRKKYDF